MRFGARSILTPQLSISTRSRRSISIRSSDAAQLRDARWARVRGPSRFCLASLSRQNAGYNVIAWNPATMAETVLPDLPRAAAVYPASGVAAMLPMTPANNFTASVLICGGVEQPNTDAVWDNARVNVTAFQGSQSCSRMDYRGAASTWTRDDDLIEGRIMGSVRGEPRNGADRTDDQSARWHSRRAQRLFPRHGRLRLVPSMVTEPCHIRS